jgi:hypothetical protein
MENETSVQAPGPQATRLSALVPLADFKAIVGIDDREDNLSRFCLLTATYIIEHYCLRRLYLKRHYERIEFYGDPFLPLREYPVRKVLAAYLMKNEELKMKNGELIEPEFYRVIPDLKGETGVGPEETVYSLMFSPALFRGRGGEAVKVVYRAGYAPGEVPPDLAAACLELAAWNMSRYRGRRIGMTGNVRGSGKDGEHLEVSMPENVRCLLEAYRRRTI